MIDSTKFWPEWQRICKRFGRTPEFSEAGDYLEYLDACGMSTDEAISAARAVWATNTFFPKPADFLESEAAYGWTALREFADQWTKHLSSDDARWLIAAVPARAKKAIESLGGFDVLRNTKDMARLRRDYFDAFARTVVEEARGPRLDSLREAKALMSGESVSVIVDAKPGKINVQLLKELAGEPLAEPESVA